MIVGTTDPRERLRQLALWSDQPVLVYASTGLPLRREEHAIEELRTLAREGLVEMWAYQGDKRYDASIVHAVTEEQLRVVPEAVYEQMVSFVDERLTMAAPAIEELGFQDAEGMLLEQVVLRRRFFSQAKLFGLDLAGLGDVPTHADMYAFHAGVEDILVGLFNELRLPTLSPLAVDDYLDLRERAHRVLPEIAEAVRSKVAESGLDRSEFKAEVDRLAGLYRTELMSALQAIDTASGREARSDYEHGSFASLEARLALLRTGGGIAEREAWLRAADGTSAFVLFLLDWRSGALRNK